MDTSVCNYTFDSEGIFGFDLQVYSEQGRTARRAMSSLIHL